MDASSPQEVIRVSGTLRQLVAHGAGNRLLQRIAERGLTPTPRLDGVGVSLDTSKRRDIRFALGALPTELATAKSPSGPDLDGFLATPCLRVSSPTRKEEVTYDWDGLISVIANKLDGAHTDEKRPKILDDLACYMVAGVPTLRYALRTVGATVASVGIRQLGGTTDIRELPLVPLFASGSPRIFAAVVIGDLENGRLDIQVQIEFRSGVQQNMIEWVQNGEPDWLFRPPTDVAPTIRPRSLVPTGRNDPCTCGSGLKYKRCCGP